MITERKPNPKKYPEDRRPKPQFPSYNFVRVKAGPRGLGNNKYDAQTGKKWPEPVQVVMSAEETAPTHTPPEALEEQAKAVVGLVAATV